MRLVYVAGNGSYPSPAIRPFFQAGFYGAFWLNILLTLLGYIPGFVHAVWIISKR